VLAAGLSAACSHGGSGAEPRVTAATTGGAFHRPFDSVPDPVAGTIYFAASDDDGAGVFSVPLEGGSAARLHTGDPYVAPFGIDLSTDGRTLFVADSGTGVDDEGSHVYGAVLVQSTAGGTPTSLAGTEGTGPRGVTVVREGTDDVVYFGGRGAIYRVPASGGAVSTVASGDPLTDPSGIAVAGDGTIYVLDTISSELGRADLLSIHDGNVSVVLTDLHVGYPAGLALTMDGKRAVVSGLDAETGHDAVFTVDLDSQAIVVLDDPQIRANVESAGLHRAKDRNTFAWADSTAGGQGIVYRVELP
jgi:sugar lactone lactonase YvrE